MDTLLYYLAENTLTPDPTDFRAVIEASRSYTDDDLVAEMLKRGTLSTKTDIIAIMNLERQVIGEIIEQGRPLNLSLFNGIPSICGVFNGSEDSFDASRHMVRYNLAPGVIIRDAIGKVKTEKTRGVVKEPVIDSYYDSVMQANNDSITPGGVGELKGSLLSFDASDPEQGIFFVNTNGEEFKVETVALNKPSKLIFMIPNLTQGEYEVKVKVRFKGSKVLKQNTLKKPIVVFGEPQK